MLWLLRLAAVVVLVSASRALAAETETRFLSGLGKDDPAQWQIQCDKGQNAGKWSTIGVPSNWELQGFGIYTYGRIKPEGGWPRVHCTYKRTFSTPAVWREKAVFVKFEGVMTDTRVSINGQAAGPLHQGGYYAFKYDITNLLKPARQLNTIQVDVDDDSMNESVNHAERRGDYWNYGGIFRPVYLEAVPKAFVDRLALSATAAGMLDVDVTLSDLRKEASSLSKASVQMRVLDLGGKPAGGLVIVKDGTAAGPVHLSEQIVNPRLWSAETPNLYQLEVQLVIGGTVVHTVHQRFGFRTIELRPGQGLFVNNQRIFLRGTARHSFWPDSGRALSEQVSRDDINVMKDLNANAVRSSHYPPDRHFLDACDELGLYVLDELNGWQAKYDTDIGKVLVKALVEHDVNHPSILFWDNGNEGGFNFDLDAEYGKYDPQKRTVLHPWAAYPPGIADANHYPTYDSLQKRLSQDPVLMPTEMLHGLYDGGAGAGLSDYWDAILKSKAGGGGFIWSFVDEDVRRTDKGGVLDSQGNMAPDGIVGPYREREASFYTIRQLWSPIVVTPTAGDSRAYTVGNRYSFLNADQCTYEWQVIAFPKPADIASGSVILGSRTDHGRSLLPGLSAKWDDWGPPTPAIGRRAKGKPDATRLLIRDVTGRLIQTYVWPVEDLDRQLETSVLISREAKLLITESDDLLTASAGDLSVRVSKTTGMLVSVSRQGKSFSLANGPRVVAMTPRLLPVRRQNGQTPPLAPSVLAPDSKLLSLTHETDGKDLVISAVFDGPMKALTYRLKPNGWLSIEYAYDISGAQEYFGIGFDYPEDKVKSTRFLGEGPAPVYKNRLAGGILDVWTRPYNNTMAGDPDDLRPGEHFNYPLFKGFYAGVHWMQFQTSEGPITALLDQRPGSPLYMQVFTPKTPPGNLQGQVAVPFPSSEISFLHAIPAIGNKFGGPQSMGPTGQIAVAQGQYKGHISLYFGQLPTPPDQLNQ